MSTIVEDIVKSETIEYAKKFFADSDNVEQAKKLFSPPLTEEELLEVYKSIRS